MDGHDYENGSDGKGEITIIVACKTLRKVWNKTISLHLLFGHFHEKRRNRQYYSTNNEARRYKLYRVQFSTAQRLFKVKGRPIPSVSLVIVWTS